jgi:RNA polymerase sigma-70 factor (ECF subfamily)
MTSIVQDDRDLVRRARGGDLDAFGELVERHRDVVHRICARMVGRHDAEDVTQEAFLRAFHRIERFRGEASFRTWVLRIAHHAALDALQQRKRHARSAAEGDDDLEQVAGPAPRSPADALEESERRERLELKIRQLRPVHRSVIVLRDVEGFSYDEISELTDQPLGSVKGRLHRARGELIDLLRNNTYDWNLPDEQ